jgi:hypothetical protein
MSEFSDPSPFYQSNKQPKLFVNEPAQLEDHIKSVTAAMDLDLESIYRKLDEALIYMNDLQAIRLVEDVRDEIYRSLK